MGLWPNRDRLSRRRGRILGRQWVDVRALAHCPRLPIALAAQLLDQGIELVLYDTYGAGADLHEA